MVFVRDDVVVVVVVAVVVGDGGVEVVDRVPTDRLHPLYDHHLLIGHFDCYYCCCHCYYCRNDHVDHIVCYRCSPLV